MKVVLIHITAFVSMHCTRALLSSFPITSSSCKNGDTLQRQKKSMYKSPGLTSCNLIKVRHCRTKWIKHFSFCNKIAKVLGKPDVLTPLISKHRNQNQLRFQCKLLSRLLYSFYRQHLKFIFLIFNHSTILKIQIPMATQIADNGDRKYLWNFGKVLLDNTVQNPRIQSSSHSILIHRFYKLKSCSCSARQEISYL